MEWGSVVSWVGVALTGFGAAFGYGRTSQKISDLEKHIETQNKRIDNLESDVKTERENRHEITNWLTRLDEKITHIMSAIDQIANKSTRAR